MLSPKGAEMAAIPGSIFKVKPDKVHSLRFEFVLLTLIIVITIMSSFGFLIVRREKALIRENLIMDGRLLAKNISISVTNTLLYEELGLVEEAGLLDNYIAEIMGTEDLRVVYAMVLDTNNRVEAHNNLMEFGKVYDDDITRKAVLSKTTLAQFYTNPRTGKQILDIATPLAISTKRWGTLRIGLSTQAINVRVMALTKKIILITLAFMGIFLGAVTAMSSRLIHPIEKLAKSMDDIKSGEYDVKNPVTRNNEIGKLQKSFIRMLDRLKAAEEEAEKSREIMIQREKMASIGVLASGVAHEINNPLGGVLNLVNQLIKTDQPPRNKEYLTFIKGGLKRIEKIIKQLLDFAQERPPELRPVDINSTVDTVVSIFQHSLGKEQNISVEKELSFDGKNLFVDEYQIEQVLMNLLLNSASFMEAGGAIKVSVSECEHCCCITVEDNGIGIPEEIQSKIFDPFFTTKGIGNGTGLGLTVSMAIIKRHEGTITVKSKPGHGSIFTVMLPLNAAEAVRKYDLSFKEGV